MRRAKLSFLALVAAGALALSACAGTPSTDPVDNPEFPAGSTMAKLAEAGTITIGTKFDQPLFGLNGLDGPEGFDVEIGKIIAAELGIAADKIRWVETVSANREPFIEGGQVDIVIATYTINDTRKQIVSFAGPYYLAGQSIMVLEGNTSISSEADLVGQPVCSATGSTPADKLAEIGAIPQLAENYGLCLGPLRAGSVVAVSTDNVILAGYVHDNPGEFKVVGEPFTDEPYGIGLKKDDTQFRMWINDILEKSYADGRYKAAWDRTAGTVLPFVTPPTPNRY